MVAVWWLSGGCLVQWGSCDRPGSVLSVAASPPLGVVRRTADLAAQKPLVSFSLFLDLGAHVARLFNLVLVAHERCDAVASFLVTIQTYCIFVVFGFLFLFLVVPSPSTFHVDRIALCGLSVSSFVCDNFVFVRVLEWLLLRLNCCIQLMRSSRSALD